MIELKSGRIWKVAAGVLSLYLVIVSLSFLNCNEANISKRPYVDADGFMGDLSCKSCHESEYSDWLGSHHDLAMQEVNDSTVLADFNETQFESNGVVSRFFRKDGGFFVNTEGPNGVFQDFEIKYTFGVTPLQQYLVDFEGGRLQCLLTAWDTEKNEWFDLMPQEKIATDDWLHWTKGSMTWNAMCADCHSTNLQKNYNETTDTYDTQWSIIDVSCEACHGPGKEHFRYINSDDYTNDKKVKGSYMKQIPGVTRVQQVNDCARCHSRRGQVTEVYNYEGTFMDHYIPSLIAPGLYQPDGQILDEVYVYGSFTQSKMAHRNVGCSDCHNPHSLDLKFNYDDNRLCTQCHVKETYDNTSHHFHEDNTDGSKCINCHMTGKIYMGNDYRRDHSFRVPRPDLSLLYNTPNACNQCHTDQSDQWSSDAIVKWYGKERQPHFSTTFAAIQSGDFSFLPELLTMVGDTSIPEIIRASGLGVVGSIGSPEAFQEISKALKDENSLVRYGAVSALSNAPVELRVEYLAPLLSDPVRTVRTHTAYMLADISEALFPEDLLHPFINATKEFEATLAVQADFPTGQLMKGQYYHKKNMLDLAEKAYREAMRQDPYLPQPHFNLATLLYSQGDLINAKELLLLAIKRDSNYVSAYYSLGLLLAETQDLNGAESNLGQAAVLSGNPRYYYNWGLTLQNLNRRKEAENAFLQAIAIQPDSEANWYALSILYIQNQEKDKARNAITRLITINPQNQEYKNLIDVVR